MKQWTNNDVDVRVKVKVSAPVKFPAGFWLCFVLGFPFVRKRFQLIQPGRPRAGRLHHTEPMPPSWHGDDPLLSLTEQYLWLFMFFCIQNTVVVVAFIGI